MHSSLYGAKISQKYLIAVLKLAIRNNSRYLAIYPGMIWTLNQVFVKVFAPNEDTRCKIIALQGRNTFWSSNYVSIASCKKMHPILQYNIWRNKCKNNTLNFSCGMFQCFNIISWLVINVQNWIMQNCDLSKLI